MTEVIQDPLGENKEEKSTIPGRGDWSVRGRSSPGISAQRPGFLSASKALLILSSFLFYACFDCKSPLTRRWGVFCDASRLSCTTWKATHYFFNVDTFTCWFPHPLFPAHQFWLSSSSFFTMQSVYFSKNYLFILSLTIAETNSDFLLLLGEIANISCMSSTALLDFAPGFSLASSQTVLSIDNIGHFLHILAGEIFLFPKLPISGEG